MNDEQVKKVIKDRRSLLKRLETMAVEVESLAKDYQEVASFWHEAEVRCSRLMDKSIADDDEIKARKRWQREYEERVGELLVEKNRLKSMYEKAYRLLEKWAPDTWTPSTIKENLELLIREQ